MPEVTIRVPRRRPIRDSEFIHELRKHDTEFAKIVAQAAEVKRREIRGADFDLEPIPAGISETKVWIGSTQINLPVIEAKQNDIERPK